MLANDLSTLYLCLICICVCMCVRVLVCLCECMCFCSSSGVPVASIDTTNISFGMGSNGMLHESRKTRAHWMSEWTNERTNEQNHLTDKANMRYSAPDAVSVFRKIWHVISARKDNTKIRSKPSWLSIHGWMYVHAANGTFRSIHHYHHHCHHTGCFVSNFFCALFHQINNFPHPTKVDVIFLYNAENNNDDNRVSLVFCLRSVPVSACLCSFFLGQISKNRLQFPVEIEIENSLANKKGWN